MNSSSNSYITQCFIHSVQQITGLEYALQREISFRADLKCFSSYPILSSSCFCHFQMSSYSCVSEYGTLQWHAESKWRTYMAFFFCCVIFNLSSADSSPFSYTKSCMAEVREQHGSRYKQQRMSEERASHSSTAICSCSSHFSLLYHSWQKAGQSCTSLAEVHSLAFQHELTSQAIKANVLNCELEEFCCGIVFGWRGWQDSWGWQCIQPLQLLSALCLGQSSPKCTTC